MHVNVPVLFVVEIDDGEDENIEHEDDFLEKLKGKVGMRDVFRARGIMPLLFDIQVPDHEMSGDGLDDDDDEDDEGSDFDIDETDLESYSTVLEANEDIDEFQIFCESLQSTVYTKPPRVLLLIQLLFLQRTPTRYHGLQSSVDPESCSRTTDKHSKHHSLHGEEKTGER